MSNFLKSDIPHLYFDKKFSTSQISPLVKMSPSGVSYYLRSKGFILRTRGEATSLADRKYGKQRDDIDRDSVVKMYVEDKKSLKDIGIIIDLTPGAVGSILKKRGIKLRSTSEGLRTKYPDGRNGALASNWKGGRRRVGLKGVYIGVYCPEHPNVSKDGYVMEHRLVMEEHIGRYLTSQEVVHHKNGDKKDNRIENLELVESRGTHTREHFERSHITEEVQLKADRYRQLLIENGIDPDQNTVVDK